MEINIPEGYMLIPKEDSEKYIWMPRDLVEDFINQNKWEKLTYPTISETAEFLNISVEKIKKDLRNITCPLRFGKYKKGGKGRGNEIMFFKSSVKNYIEWLKQK